MKAKSIEEQLNECLKEEKAKDSDEGNKSFHDSFDKCIEDKWASGMVQGMPEDGDILL